MNGPWLGATFGNDEIISPQEADTNTDLDKISDLENNTTQREIASLDANLKQEKLRISIEKSNLSDRFDTILAESAEKWYIQFINNTLTA